MKTLRQNCLGSPTFLTYLLHNNYYVELELCIYFSATPRICSLRKRRLHISYLKFKQRARCLARSWHLMNTWYFLFLIILLLRNTRTMDLRYKVWNDDMLILSNEQTRELVSILLHFFSRLLQLSSTLIKITPNTTIKTTNS